MAESDPVFEGPVTEVPPPATGRVRKVARLALMF